MSRKPFEALGPHNLVCDCHAKADAAIAQDKEYALRRIREENHEGMIYYRERDEARAERDALREEVAAQQRENERLKAQVGAEQLDADRVRTASRELEVEVERLKERLEKSESRRTHWDAVTLTNYEATKAQLAEAVKVIERIFEICDETDELNGKRLAREFLAKAKT